MLEVENLVAKSNRLISTEKGVFQIGNHFVQTASQSFCWKTFKDFLIKHGFTVTGKWMGPISLCGIVIFWAMEQVDKGNSVNLKCELYVSETITARWNSKAFLRGSVVTVSL